MVYFFVRVVTPSYRTILYPILRYSHMICFGSIITRIGVYLSLLFLFRQSNLNNKAVRAGKGAEQSGPSAVIQSF